MRSVRIFPGIGLVGAALLVAVFLPWPSPSATRAQSGRRPVVVCSVLPLQIFAQNIVGDTDGVVVEPLLQPDVGCPHDYSLATRDRKRLDEASVVLAIGLGLESFLDPIRKDGKPRIVDLADGCTLIRTASTGGHKHADGEHHDHHHDQIANPHVWLSPKEALLIVERMKSQLTALDTAHAKQFEANATRYRDVLGALQRETTEAAKGLKRRKVVASDAFAYLARDLGIEVVATLPGHAGEGQSARQMGELVKTIKSTSAAAILFEPVSEKLAKTLAREAGVPAVELDPLTTVASGKIPADYYEQRTRANLAALAKALGAE